jgi:hypothetical protein
MIEAVQSHTSLRRFALLSSLLRIMVGTAFEAFHRDSGAETHAQRDWEDGWNYLSL